MLLSWHSVYFLTCADHYYVQVGEREERKGLTWWDASMLCLRYKSLTWQREALDGVYVTYGMQPSDIGNGKFRENRDLDSYSKSLVNIYTHIRVLLSVFCGKGKTRSKKVFPAPPPLSKWAFPLSKLRIFSSRCLPRNCSHYWN